MMEFVDICKICVVDNDEIYVIDEVSFNIDMLWGWFVNIMEYFFLFFSFGREVINILKI